MTASINCAPAQSILGQLRGVQLIKSPLVIIILIQSVIAMMLRMIHITRWIECCRTVQQTSLLKDYGTSKRYGYISFSPYSETESQYSSIGPDLLRDLADERELAFDILRGNIIALRVWCEATLRADANSWHDDMLEWPLRGERQREAYWFRASSIERFSSPWAISSAARRTRFFNSALSSSWKKTT